MDSFLSVVSLCCVIWSAEFPSRISINPLSVARSSSVILSREMLSHHRLLQRILVRPVVGQSSLRFGGLFHILTLDRPHESWLYILDGLCTTHFDLDCEVMSLVCIACFPCENLESHACPSAIQSRFPLLDLHSVHNRSCFSGMLICTSHPCLYWLVHLLEDHAEHLSLVFFPLLL